MISLDESVSSSQINIAVAGSVNSDARISEFFFRFSPSFIEETRTANEFISFCVHKSTASDYFSTHVRQNHSNSIVNCSALRRTETGFVKSTIQRSELAIQFLEMIETVEGTKPGRFSDQGRKFDETFLFLQIFYQEKSEPEICCHLTFCTCSCALFCQAPAVKTNGQ